METQSFTKVDYLYKSFLVVGWFVCFVMPVHENPKFLIFFLVPRNGQEEDVLAAYKSLDQCRGLSVYRLS